MSNPAYLPPISQTVRKREHEHKIEVHFFVNIFYFSLFWHSMLPEWCSSCNNDLNFSLHHSRVKGHKGICEESCTSSQKRLKNAYLTDERTELTRSETIIDTSEDGNGDYNVAEETSKVVEGVYPNWERRGQSSTRIKLWKLWVSDCGCIGCSYYKARALC